MATGSFTIDGGSAHSLSVIVHDSGKFSEGLYSSFSSFVEEHGTFTSSSFTGYGSGSLTLYDRYDGGATVISGTDTISATMGGVTIGGTINVEEITPKGTELSLGHSTYQLTFGAAAGNASLTGAQYLSSSLFESPASATGGLSGADTKLLGLAPDAAKSEMTGADTLKGAMAAAVEKTTESLPAATTIKLHDASITIVPNHTLKS